MLRSIQKFDCLVTLLCVGLLSFFGWHAYHGPRGFLYINKLSVQTAGLEQQLKGVVTQRDVMKQRVVLLRPDSIDPDMLDEQARAALSLSAPNEIVVSLPLPTPLN